jgi:ferredoxin
MPNLAVLEEKQLAENPPQNIQPVVLRREQLAQLIDAFRSQGYEVIGPRVRDGAIVYDRLTKLDELPAGWTDQQSEGRYRLERRSDSALFGYTVGPRSWKKFLYPPRQHLASSQRLARGFALTSEAPPDHKYVFFGVRSCDLHAIALHDRVFLEGPFPDPGYRGLRESAFIVAVNCGQAGGTCFCASMKAGPRATAGYDLALTELGSDGEFRYLVETGSERGAEVLATIPRQAATESDKQDAETLYNTARRQMGRSLDMWRLQELLYANTEHPIWDGIAERCLSCGNCTMVCPTCFCTTVEDTTDLAGTRAERWRRWDSCFTLDFSYIHGGSIRVSAKSRYRQWMTHKLASWTDQFGKPGCVGCGRCITWCPVGIDLTAEARALRESDITGPEEFSRSSHDSSND